MSQKAFKICSQYSKLLKKIAICFYFYQQGWMTRKIIWELCRYINWKYSMRFSTLFSFPDSKKLLSLVLLINLIWTAIMEIMHGNIIPWKHHNISFITNKLYHNIMGSSISSWILGHLKNILKGWLIALHFKKSWMLHKARWLSSLKSY